jgi:regulatory protein
MNEPESTRSSDRPAKPAKSPGKGSFALSLKGRALRLLASREQSRSELEKKLKAHEETSGQLAQVLDELQAKDFISEARVVESVINRRQAKLGASRIRQELFSKGIDKEAVIEAMQGLKATELARARELWQRKFAAKLGDQPPDKAAQAKQMRFLAARGFSGDVIRRVLAPPDDE